MGVSLEALAMLNPKTIRYNIGRGGMPELTSEDVAAALGMVPNALGRELLIHCYWPDGAARAAGKLDGIVCLLLHEEITRRAHRYQSATLALNMARDRASGHRKTPTAEQAEIRRLECALSDARADMWPMVPERWWRLRQAVLDELAGNSLCPACGGRGHVQADALQVRCEACGGSGIAAVSDAARAAAIGVSRQKYADNGWRGMYEWLYSQLVDARADAARAFLAALGD